MTDIFSYQIVDQNVNPSELCNTLFREKFEGVLAIPDNGDLYMKISIAREGDLDAHMLESSTGTSPFLTYTGIAFEEEKSDGSYGLRFIVDFTDSETFWGKEWINCMFRFLPFPDDLFANPVRDKAMEACVDRMLEKYDVAWRSEVELCEYLRGEVDKCSLITREHV